MKTKNLFALALTLAAVAFACKKTVPLSEETSEIRFRMAQSPISVSTKAQAVTSLSSFQVTATTGITGSEVPAWENVTFSGWEIFTEHIIKYLNDNCDHLVFLLWGRDARNKKAMIDASKHLVLESAHPSPLSAYNGFFGKRRI